MPSQLSSQQWIWQLRYVIDKADDVLDDFEYMKLEEEQQQLNMEETKVRSSFTRLFSEPARKLRRACERALKIDSNLERLEAVVKKLERSVLFFISSKTQSRSSRSWSFSCAKILKQDLPKNDEEEEQCQGKSSFMFDVSCSC